MNFGLITLNLIFVGFLHKLSCTSIPYSVTALLPLSPNRHVQCTCLFNEKIGHNCPRLPHNRKYGENLIIDLNCKCIKELSRQPPYARCRAWTRGGTCCNRPSSWGRRPWNRKLEIPDVGELELDLGLVVMMTVMWPS